MFFPKKIKTVASKKRKVALNLDINQKGGEFLRQKNIKKVGNTLFSDFRFTWMNNSRSVSRTIFKQNGRMVASVVNRGVFGFEKKFATYSLVLTTKNDIVGFVRYQETPIFSCSEGTYYTKDAETATQIGTDYFKSLAVCYDRIFGVNGHTLSMTSAGDISNWDDSRQITAHTQLDAVIALDKLYVLGDTCYTLTPDAEEINMKFAPFCHGIGTVQTESVVAVDKRAIFASVNGLYELKSNSITPIFTELNEYLCFDGCVACLYQGKYYITCKRKDGKLERNDILLALDIDSKKIYAVLDLNVSHINVIDDALYVVIDNQVLFLDGVEIEDEAFVFRFNGIYTETVDFNSSKIKYLDKLTVRSLTDVDVWISNDSEKRRYHIKGKRTAQSVPLAGSGREFTVEVEAKSKLGLQLNYLELSAHTYEV